MPWLYALYGFGIGLRMLVDSGLWQEYAPRIGIVSKRRQQAYCIKVWARASAAAVCMLRHRHLRLPLAPTLAPVPSLGFQPGHATR